MENAVVISQMGQFAHYSYDQMAIVKNQIAKGLTDEEFTLFVEYCKSTGLNPLTGQVFAVVRGKDDNRKVAYQTSIDGFRSIAESTGQYDGYKIQWLVRLSEKEVAWFDYWFPGLGIDPTPMGAMAYVYRKGCTQPFSHFARFDAYAVYNDVWENKVVTGKKLSSFWARMTDWMIGKCALAGALRAAFPNNLSRLYVNEEMQQADDIPHEVIPDNRMELPKNGEKAAPKKAAPAEKTTIPIDYVGKFQEIINLRAEKGKPAIEVLSDIVAAPLNEGELMALYAKFKTVKSPDDLDVFVAYANEVLDAAAKRTTTTSNDFPL